jgi:hypothetical protein
MKVFFLLLLTFKYGNCFDIIAKTKQPKVPIEKDYLNFLFQWINENAKSIEIIHYEKLTRCEKPTVSISEFKNIPDSIIHKDKSWSSYIIIPKNDVISNEDKTLKQKPFYCYSEYNQKEKERTVGIVAFNSLKPLHLGCANKYYYIAAKIQENKELMLKMEDVFEKCIPKYILQKED